MATTTQENTTTGTNHEASGAAAAAGELFDQAKKKVGEVASKAKDEVGHQLEAQKDRAVGNLGGVADALRSTSEQLRSGDHGGMTGYVDAAAEQVDKLSGYLKDKDLGQLVHEVEAFARREPALFLGGAFTLGLLASRFLKSSGRSGSSATYDRYGQPAFDDDTTAPYGRSPSTRGDASNHRDSYAGSAGAGTYGSSAYGNGRNGAGSYGGPTSPASQSHDKSTSSAAKPSTSTTSSAASSSSSNIGNGNGNGNGSKGNGSSGASSPSSSSPSTSTGASSPASTTTATSPTTPATTGPAFGSGGTKKS